MKLGQTVILGALMAIAWQTASAFQETTGGSQDTAAKGTTAPGLTTPMPQASTSQKEISIPGLGSIGVLPKLDFGLELLYGANGPSRSPADEKADSGAQIRGTLKYRFPN